MHARPFDNDVRLFVYRHFVTGCRAPTVTEAAAATGVPEQEIRLSFDRLAEAHILVLDDATGEIRMAMPFSATETPYRVIIGESRWFAN